MFESCRAHGSTTPFVGDPRGLLPGRRCHAFAMSRLSASDACEESQEGPYRDSPISSSFQCSYRRCDPRRRRQS